MVSFRYKATPFRYKAVDDFITELWPYIGYKAVADGLTTGVHIYTFLTCKRDQSSFTIQFKLLIESETLPAASNEESLGESTIGESAETKQ